MTNITDHSNFLTLLMEAAQREPNTDLRQGLKASAAGIQAAIHLLCSGQVTVASKQEFNAMWEYAGRLLTLHYEQLNSLQGNKQPQSAA